MTRKQRIAELEQEVAEDRDLRRELIEERDQYRAILNTILAEHPPMPVTPLAGGRIELRCKRCHTDEHHTWANDNHMLWPCPTLAPFVQYAVYEPQGEQEAGE